MTANHRLRTVRTGISFRFELNNKPRKNGLYNILFRITENRVIKRLATAEEVNKLWWDAKKEEVKARDPRHISKNSELQRIKNEALTLLQTIPNVTADKILKALRGEKTYHEIVCLLEYTNQRYLMDKPFNTVKNTTTIVNKLVDFTGQNRLPFEDITPDFLNRFEKYLSQKCKNNGNTVDTNLSKLRAIINHAIQNGRISVNLNPFRSYRIKECTPIIKRLDESELQLMKDVVLPQFSLLWHVRNYWLFSYYSAGLRFSDFATLKWKDIDSRSQDGFFITYRIHKTGKVHSIPVPKQAVAILNHYRPASDAAPSGLIFPVLNKQVDFNHEKALKQEISRKNALVNKYLKKLCQAAGINKPVAFHMARHTFADMARIKTGDIYGISKSLRHQKLATTERYLASMDETAVTRTMAATFADEN